MCRLVNVMKTFRRKGGKPRKFSNLEISIRNSHSETQKLPGI